MQYRSWPILFPLLILSCLGAVGYSDTPRRTTEPKTWQLAPPAPVISAAERLAELANNSVLLMDCAAEFDHYTADITRSIPVNGKFTKEQADIYRFVYEAQVESIKLVKAGGTKDAAQKKAAEVIKEGLLKLGLITSKENTEFRTWFMHGTSHWLGMNVHDVGTTDTFAPGMILTVEPGIYIRPDALDVLPKTPENEKFIQAVRPAFEKYKGIGVRIEDDILVTDGEPRIMSDALPRKLEDVEAFIARLKQQANKAGLP
jgi:Xaa-Pro aminopeptidase